MQMVRAITPSQTRGLMRTISGTLCSLGTGSHPIMTQQAVHISSICEGRRIVLSFFFGMDGF